MEKKRPANIKKVKKFVNKSGQNKVYMLGAGGHASVLMDILKKQNIKVSGIFAPAMDLRRKIFSGIPFSTNEDEVLQLEKGSVWLVNGLGFLPGSTIRDTVAKKFKSHGFKFLTVIARSAEVSEYAKIGSGVQLLNGVTVQAGAIIQDDTIINTRAIVEHDCLVGSASHLAPNSTMCGGVRTGKNVFIGSNATILPGHILADAEIIPAGCIR